MTTCIVGKNIPCVSVGIKDIGRWDFTLDLDEAETIASATVTETGGIVIITNAQSNTSSYFDVIEQRTVAAQKAVEFNYENPTKAVGLYTLQIVATTSLGREIPVEALLEMV